MKRLIQYAVTVLLALFLADCSVRESSQKTFSFHAVVRVPAGGSVAMQGTRDFSEFLMYGGKQDSMATVGYERNYHTPYRSDGYNPRQHEENTQTVSATAGTVFTVRGMEQSFEIISCDEKELVVRVR